jgi:hypothetical protein
VVYHSLRVSSPSIESLESFIESLEASILIQILTSCLRNPSNSSRSSLSVFPAMLLLRFDRWKCQQAKQQPRISIVRGRVMNAVTIVLLSPTKVDLRLRVCRTRFLVPGRRCLALDHKNSRAQISTNPKRVFQELSSLPARASHRLYVQIQNWEGGYKDSF